MIRCFRCDQEWRSGTCGCPDGVTLVNGDAVAVLSEVPESTFDLYVTDPPYGTKTQPREGWMVGEYSNVMPILLPEMHRSGKPNAALYLFTSWTNLADRCSPYFRQQGILVWDKGRHSGCWGKFSWQFHWEAIFYGLKGPRDIREYYPDVLRSKETANGESMQKPVDVIEKLIQASSDEGDLVFDGFAGTGSSLLAARNLKRRVLGCEIDRTYCAKIAERLRQRALF